MLNTLKTRQTTKDQFIKKINYCDLCCINVCRGTAMICRYFLEQYFIVTVKILLVNHTSPVVNLNSLPYIL